MFYLFLIVLSFTEFYFFRLLNQVIFRGTDLSGDIYFAGFCILLSVLILIGTIHIKHLNREWVKKLGIGIIIVSVIYFLASCLTFNFNYIVSSIEFSIIFSVAGLFLFIYETAPEGEPDVEAPEVEEEKEFLIDYAEPLDNFDAYDGYSEFEEFPVYEEEVFENEDLKNLNNLIIEIEVKSTPENFETNLTNTKKLIESVYNANSEYREENLDNLTYILNLYNNELENGENSNIIQQINNSIDLINKNLENLYYNTRGAQVFKTEQNVKSLKEELENQI